MTPHELDELRLYLARITGAERVELPERIQSLWGGYGELLRFRLIGCARSSVVVKWAKPPADRGPQSRGGETSHARKARSYDVESAFYQTVAARCDSSCRVASLVGPVQVHRANEWILALDDLDAAGFSRRERDPRGDDLRSCLAWLASFHARFLGEQMSGLWPIGTYWHLETRPDEFAKAIGRDPTLRTRAVTWDRALREARYQTLLHGDAKPANFCFARQDHAVAAVDFQYAGGGPGIRDIAYLMHGESDADSAAALDVYFGALRDAVEPQIDFVQLENEWRALYPIAIADFERFLLGWRD